VSDCFGEFTLSRANVLAIDNLVVNLWQFAGKSQLTDSREAKFCVSTF